MTKTDNSLREIVFVPRVNGMIVQTPSFLTGEPGKRIFNAYEKRKVEFGDNPHFQLEWDGNHVAGANVPDANLIDQIVRPYGVRASLPQDWNEEFMRMTDNRYYTTANALVFRSLKDDFNPANDVIAKTLAEKGAIDTARAQRKPALITGFEIVPHDDKGYGFVAVPNKEFNAHYDDRFLEKYDGWRFEETDEIGMPQNLDKQKGSRTWYTRENGISRFILNRNRLLSSGWYGLACSGSDGRVALVSAEGDAPDYSNILEQTQKSELLKRIDGAREYLEKVSADLRGKK